MSTQRGIAYDGSDIGHYIAYPALPFGGCDSPNTPGVNCAALTDQSHLDPRISQPCHFTRKEKDPLMSTLSFAANAETGRISRPPLDEVNKHASGTETEDCKLSVALTRSIASASTPDSL